MPVKRRRTSARRARQRGMRQADMRDMSTDRGPGAVGVIGLLMAVMLVGGAIFFIAIQSGKGSGGGGYASENSMGVDTEIEDSVRREFEEAKRMAGDFEEEALKVAEKFLEEPDPEKRLKYVRNFEEVAHRIEEYHEQARTVSHTGFYKNGGFAEGMRSVAFSVTYDNGPMRILEVVDTDQGAKADWDSFARYSTVPWEELMSDGGRDEGVVRVFVQPGDYHNPPFDDHEEWKSFRITSPDINRPIYGFAEMDGELANRIKDLFMVNGTLPQPMTVRIKRHPGPYDNMLFSLEELLAAGWVLPDAETGGLSDE